MKTQDKIRKRLRDLREAGNRIRLDNEFAVDPEDCDEKCQAWLVAVQSTLHSLFGNIDHPYRSNIVSISDQDEDLELLVRVGKVSAILEHLISDLEDDLIFSIESRTRATVFEEFLEESKSYVESQHHREAGVLAAMVFEDALRSLARKHGISCENIRTDEVISQMTKEGVLSTVKAKRARTSAGVRNKALHAQWEEIDLGDVKTLIVFTEELISRIDEK